jgi:hypothetical protein
MGGTAAANVRRVNLPLYSAFRGVVALNSDALEENSVWHLRAVDF